MNSKTCLRIVAAFVGAARLAGAADSVPLDISTSYNYDLWIGNAEKAYTGSSNLLVGTLFGQHNVLYENNRSYAFQDQGSASYTGLPVNGRISTNIGGIVWNFQICTNRENVPPGGYSPGNLLRYSNIVYSGVNQGYVTNRIDLAPTDQKPYAQANFLYNGGGNVDGTYVRYHVIRALYATGDTQQLFRTDWTLAASWSTNNLGDATNTPAFMVTKHWGQTGSYSDVRAGSRQMYVFTQPLALDAKRTLVGFEVITRCAGSNRSIYMQIYAVAAVPAKPAGSAVFLR